MDDRAEGRLRVLVIEDLEDDALLLVRELSQAHYKPHWRRVDTPEMLAAALDGEEWDIIFADHSMPHFSGVRALTLVRERGLDTPFIFVSGTIGEDTAVAAMKAGAQDYIMKGNLKRLLPAVERELREAQLRRERRRAEYELNLLEAATRAATEAGDVLAALEVTLDKICEGTCWTLAQVWLPRSDGKVLECSSAWYCNHGDMETFRTVSLGRTVMRGEDLPGRSWASKQPAWIPNIGVDADFARASFAREAGLNTAIVLPVLANDDVIAVLELFTRETRDEDARSVRLFSAVVAQLGGIIQRKRAEERLHHMAHYDDLTGLPNRVLFTDRLRQAILEAHRHGRMVGVIFLDLDRFKTINDSLGHGAGDILLRGVAERLGRCVRDGDTVARLAGDEFTLVLADMASADNAAQVARKIQSTLAESFHVLGHDLFTTASIGMTLYPADDFSVDGLLRNADIAMYRAKESGGNGFQFYSKDMTAKVRDRLSMENALRRGLDREEFILDYQPIVSLHDRSTVAVEALVRWNHPERGLIYPTEFVPLAEETGLIQPLGEWVMQAVIQESARLARAGFPELRVAINLSAHQFRQHEIVHVLRRMLRAAGVRPNQLQLEITETVLMQSLDVTAVALRELADMGVELSLDDFGTGYSSLSYLKRFPIDVLKIDRSFVRDVPADTDDAAIASAIISMAHMLGIQVIAEGVETQEQLDFFRGRDCDHVQGFFISPPRSPQGLNAWLAENRTPLPP
jgi:diguanylate cyclase (GGDEF)-like protein